MSLPGSIFGGDKKEGSGLSGLFEASSALPDKPQHKALPKRRKKKKVEFAETDETSDKKKKRKRKDDDATKVDTKEDTKEESKDDATKEEGKEESKDDDETKKEESKEQQPQDDRTVFVGNLPLNTTRNQLKSIFTKCGKVESTRLRSIATTGVKVTQDQKGNQALVKKVSANTKQVDGDARTSAQGYVVFVDKESVVKALELNNFNVATHRIRVDRLEPTMDASRSVFVGNLPYQADEATLRQHFMKGCAISDVEIENVRIVRDKITQQCKGFGYVLFSTKSIATTALQRMHDSEYKRRNLRVTVCGKRFKGRRGDASEKEKAQKPVDAAGALKRILKKEAIGTKRKRGDTSSAGGPQKTVANPGGVSRRQASENKLEKRHKKLQKRASKGMGKTKKGY